MGIVSLILDRLNVVGAFRELAGTPQRVTVLLALAASQLLVQLTFLPVTLATPSVADYFSVDVDDAAWTVIIRLLMLGSTVFLTSRLGEKFGHVRIFFLGICVLTAANLLATTSQTLWQLILWCGVGGFGGALIISNSNAIIAMVFEPNERGRAFAVPVTASRLGTLLGLLLFGLFLEFVSWRLVYLSALLVGLAAIWFCMPLLKYQGEQWAQTGGERAKVKIDYLAAAVLMAVLATFVLSGTHLHDGAESFSTPQALGYHIPMHILSLALAWPVPGIAIPQRHPLPGLPVLQAQVLLHGSVQQHHLPHVHADHLHPGSHSGGGRSRLQSHRGNPGAAASPKLWPVAAGHRRLYL